MNISDVNQKKELYEVDTSKTPKKRSTSDHDSNEKNKKSKEDIEKVDRITEWKKKKNDQNIPTFTTSEFQYRILMGLENYIDLCKMSEVCKYWNGICIRLIYIKIQYEIYQDQYYEVSTELLSPIYIRRKIQQNSHCDEKTLTNYSEKSKALCYYSKFFFSRSGLRRDSAYRFNNFRGSWINADITQRCHLFENTLIEDSLWCIRTPLIFEVPRRSAKSTMIIWLAILVRFLSPKSDILIVTTGRSARFTCLENFKKLLSRPQLSCFEYDIMRKIEVTLVRSFVKKSRSSSASFIFIDEGNGLQMKDVEEHFPISRIYWFYTPSGLYLPFDKTRRDITYVKMSYNENQLLPTDLNFPLPLENFESDNIYGPI